MTVTKLERAEHFHNLVEVLDADWRELPCSHPSLRLFTQDGWSIGYEVLQKPSRLSYLTQACTPDECLKKCIRILEGPRNIEGCTSGLEVETLGWTRKETATLLNSEIRYLYGRRVYFYEKDMEVACFATVNPSGSKVWEYVAKGKNLEECIENAGYWFNSQDTKTAPPSQETLPSGSVQSKEIPGLSLLQLEPLKLIAEVRAYGAAKYGRDNHLGIPIESSLDHAILHIYKYMAGEPGDVHPSPIGHLAQAVNRLMMAMDVALKDTNCAS